MSDGSLGSLHRWRSQRIAKLLVVWIARHIGPILVAAEHLTYWTYISLSRLIYCIQHTVDCSALGWECFLWYTHTILILSAGGIKFAWHTHSHCVVLCIIHILNFSPHKETFSFNIFSCHTCYAMHTFTSVQHRQYIPLTHTLISRWECVCSGYFLAANIHTHT